MMKKKEASGFSNSSHFIKTLHMEDPDYSNPPLEVPPEARNRMLAHLRLLYGEEEAAGCLPELERILKVYYAHKPRELIDAEKEIDPKERFTEKDMVLITYGDLFRGGERSPLATLADLCDTYLRAINTLHILPFYPYSSDRGFSVIDFRAVDPRLGSWQDINFLEERYQLMFDGVINHVSSRSDWFRKFLNGNPDYEDFFIAFSSQEELTIEDRGKIFRPRTSDILTRFQTINGPRHVWTTFSADQIDLNYKNPKVLLSVIDLLLFYIRQGTDMIRLDAVSYIWAEPETTCVHLNQAHEIVKLFRTVLDVAAPHVALITEANLPHEQNVSYFGNGFDEARMAYNFALPPLVLYSFYKQDATVLTRWAKSLDIKSDTTAFFNILDTHDGIGLMGAKNILSEEEIDFLIGRARENGAFISYRREENGGRAPYEINTTWWSALDRDDGDEDMAFKAARFMASRCVPLVLQGVPGIYAHGALGTSNDPDIVETSRGKREINRQSVDSRAIAKALEDPDSKLSHIGPILRKMNVTRTAQRAFHPNGRQVLLTVSPGVFSILRISPEGDRHILALINVSDRMTDMKIGFSNLGIEESLWVDLLSGKQWAAQGRKLPITLRPYEVIWLKPYHQMDESELPSEAV
ncbi:MAG: alpha-amylase family glycosyl hydrolase, partial [Nitrospinota bacterium]|nr:alpha-amylase family glycosyl hydrolase [Nitrospinota bacterium]